MPQTIIQFSGTAQIGQQTMAAQIGKPLAIVEFRQPVLIGFTREPRFEIRNHTRAASPLCSNSDQPPALSSSNNPSALKSPLATPDAHDRAGRQGPHVEP